MIRLAGVLLVGAVSMSTGEFVEVQKLSPDELRARFKLPPSCEPSMTAHATDPAVNVMTVAIECRLKPGATPATTSPPRRPRPRLPEKGS
jgi:hypothetical protein